MERRERERGEDIISPLNYLSHSLYVFSFPLSSLSLSLSSHLSLILSLSLFDRAAAGGLFWQFQYGEYTGCGAGW